MTLGRVSLALVFVLAACSNPSVGSSQPAPITAGSSLAIAQGRVEKQTFTSAALGVDKQVVVYLPAGYDADPAKRWPVFYYLHGLGGDETNWVDAASSMRWPMR